MPEEFKTLLKVEGDASGAKKAAEETKSATESLGASRRRVDKDAVDSAAASVKAGDQTAQSTARTTEALANQTEAAGRAHSGIDKLAASMGVSKEAALGMRQALGAVNPELARLVEIGARLEGEVSAGIGKIAIVMGTIAVAAAAVEAAFDKIQEAIGRAEEAAKRYAATQQRIRAEAQEKQSTAAEGAASAGLPPAAAGKVRAITDRLAAKGVDRAAAEAAAPYFVDDTGRQLVSDEEMAKITAAQQFGFIEPMTGAGRKRPAALAKAQRQMRRGETESLAQNAVRNLQADVEARLDALVQGQDEKAIRDFVERETGLSGKDLDARVDKVIRQMREGPRGWARPGEVRPPSPFKWDLPDMWRAIKETLPEEEDPLVHSIRSTGRRGTRPAAAGEAAAGAAQSAAGSVVNYITNHYNHGTINQGRPNSQPVQRGIAP